jgi:hypothetical protein
MVKIRELTPGDLVKISGLGKSIFIGRVPQHPLYPNLSLVIWWLEHEKRYGFDALDPGQQIDATVDSSNRIGNFRRAIVGPGI